MAGIFDNLLAPFSTGPADQAAAAQTQGLNTGYQQLADLYGLGNQTLASNYAQGLQPFQQNFANAQQGQTALGNALGLNGPSGNAAATQAFQNNPGYQFLINQATQGVDRNQAAAGMLGSGNTNLDLANQISGIANQGWNQYIQNLQPYQGAAQNAAQGIGGLFSGLGQGINQNVTNQGQAAYGTQAGIGNANANAALAQYQAGNNLWGLLGGIGKLGVSGAGSAAGAGGTAAGAGGTLGGNALSSLGSGVMSGLGSIGSAAGTLLPFI
jgi:hypothetical protein